MLDEQQDVFTDLARDSPSRDIALQVQRGSVAQGPEIDDQQLVHGINRC